MSEQTWVTDEQFKQTMHNVLVFPPEALRILVDAGATLTIKSGIPTQVRTSAADDVSGVFRQAFDVECVVPADLKALGEALDHISTKKN